MKLNISLYIPVYNGESTIESVLKNALQLDPGADEIIIIDDGSNDQTKEILKKYENRITIIKNKTNQGLGFSRNLAISKSKHQLVASIDADVEPEKKWLLKLYETQKNLVALFVEADCLKNTKIKASIICGDIYTGHRILLVIK